MRLPPQLILLLLLWREVSLLRAEPVPAADSFWANCRVTRWTAENGLPQNNIKALLQTKDGYIWIGTLYGLARFDGFRFKIYDHSNTPEMVHDSINDLAEDTKDGSLWIGTGNGLLRYRKHQFERYGSDLGHIGSVGNLKAGSNGGVWFTPHAGALAYVRQGKPRIWELGVDLQHNEIHGICERGPTEVLVGMALELKRLNPLTGEISTIPVSVPSFSANRLWEADNHSIWLGTPGGAWRGDGQNWEPVPGLSELPDWIRRSRSGAVFAQTTRDGGSSMFRLVDGKFRRWPSWPIPEGVAVSAILEDSEGNLWAGSDTALYKIARLPLKVYSRAQGLPSSDILAVAQAPDHTLWIATGAGVTGMAGGKFLNYPLPEGIYVSRPVSVLAADSRNRLWAQIGFEALWRFENGFWDRIPSPGLDLIKMGGVKALSEDPAGRMWVGFGNGVFTVEGGVWTRQAPGTALAAADVRFIHHDKGGAHWFGTYGQGLFRLKDGAVTAYRTPLDDYNNRAWCIHEDASGVFWVGSQNGLNRFEPPRSGLPEGRFFTFTTREGLRENVVNNIQEDDSGFLWLTGLRGIYRIPRRELDEVAAGRETEPRCTAFGEADGMLSSECNGGENQPAGCKDYLGRLWFPTVNGLVLVDPAVLRQAESPPPVVLESVIADGVVVFGDDRKPGIEPASHAPPVFGAGRARVLEFRYAANSFTDPGRVRFKYRLEGYDGGWRRDDQNRRVAFYNNLRPGPYTFRVIACDNHGRWNHEGARFSFRIAPHFWQTWYFYALCAAGLFGLAAAVHANRLHWQRRLLKLEQQRALANERTRIARDLHDDLGTALTGLALELDVIRRDGSALGPVSQRLAQTAGRTRDLAERMREVVWTVNPSCDTVSSLAGFLEQQASQFLKSDGLSGRFDFPEDIPPLPMDAETRHELALSVREALTNVVRHARASEVVVRLEIRDGNLVITVADNGAGFLLGERLQPNHGLENMRGRLARIGGVFECASTPGRGTCLSFVIPLRQTPGSPPPKP